ncbi:ABC transporter substrate-binding protein [Methanoregula sp.]|uniref:ABC transporter substrate-binding protein n=1 Tax=Methanoregula sp. TaxID=2052170 RepID=UPI00356A8EF5
MEENLHKTRDRIIIFTGICLIVIIALFLSGWASMPGTATGVTAKSQQLSAGDVIIPVDSPTSITYSNSMKKDSSPPTVYEHLVDKDLNGKFTPALAESWEASADARTWTFHLANATWNDGVPFTCSDVKFTKEYMKNNNLTLAFVLNDVETIDCPDPHTAVFTLKTSYSGFLDQISHTPGITFAPRHFWENITDPQTYRDTKFIGTGPFVFVKAEPGYVQLKRNDAYHGTVPKVTGVVLKLITNPDSQVLALKNGEIDVVSGISPAVAQNLQQEKNISIYTIRNSATYEIAFNLNQYPANISGFRKAMSHAVDRDTISSLIGTGSPTNTTFLIPDLAGDYVNPADVGMYDYDLVKAQEMLAAAGFTKDRDGKLLGPDKKPITITIPTGGEGGSGKQNTGVNSGSGTTQKLVTVLKNDWAKLGITVSTVTYDDKTRYRSAVNANPVFIDSFPVQLHDNANALIDFAVTPMQETNYYNYNNPEYNRLVSQMKNTSDQGVIKTLGYRMQDLLAQDIPTVPVCTTDTIVAYRNDRFTGWDIGPGYYSILNPDVLESLTPVKAS